MANRRQNVTDQENRIEPILSNRTSGDQQSNESTFKRVHPEQNERRPIRWSIVLIIVLLSVLASSQVWQRIQEHRAQKAIQQWADDAEQALIQAQRELENVRRQTQAQQAARQQRLRQTRADSSQGKWLAKNCSDWRRAHDELPTRTTAEEMQRHCATYQRYLETGRY